MVDECCFHHEINFANAGVLKHLTSALSRGEGALPELKDEWSDAQKLKVIEKAYQELSNPAHLVAIAMERQKTVPEVRIIEGLP